jgi:hypothetical protein
MRRLKTWFWPSFAVLLPLLGLSAMALRAELATRRGTTLRVAIRGYDPRDLLHGRYLRYQFDFEWTEPNTCGNETPAADTLNGIPRLTSSPRLDPDCCLCLTRHSDATYPKVRQLGCTDPHDHCAAWLRSATVTPPLRYFVPETSAPRLEAALPKYRAAVEIVASPKGDLVVSELLLDGRPWREVLGD